ncbi:MAG: O-methyltransferase [Solirubrobacterales bacterium]
MPILADQVAAYLEELRPQRDPLMCEMEELAAKHGIPIVHWETGRLLAVLARSLGEGAHVLEVGTAIGYSTLHMARALDKGGRVVTIERDAVRVEQARGYLERAGVADHVEVIEGDALDVIIGLQGPFDLLFLDATKGEYARYLELAESKASEHALLAIDNVLMSGAVAFDDDADVPDEFGGWWAADQRRAVRALNSGLIGSERWLSVVLAVGDGVLLGARKP